MNRRTHSLTIVLATLALLSALSLPGIFLWPLNAIRIDSYYMDEVLLVASMDALRILFLLVPVVSLIGAIRGKLWGLYGIMVFSVIAWVFGVGGIPYLAHLFTPGMHRTIAITVINLVVIEAATWILCLRSNNSCMDSPVNP